MEQANRSEAVNQFMQNLEHPLKAEIEALREIILNTDAQITEHIKWNAPSFCYQGEDRVTFQIFPVKNQIKLIFHRGAKAKDSRDLKFQDENGLLRWISGDRASIAFRSMEEVQANVHALKSIVSRWIALTS